MSTANAIGLFGLMNIILLGMGRLNVSKDVTARGVLCGYGMAMLFIATLWTCVGQKLTFSVGVFWVLAALNLGAALIFYLREKLTSHDF